jgi:hypothetical protein
MWPAWRIPTAVFSLSRPDYGQKTDRKSDEQLLSEPGNLATTAIVSNTTHSITPNLEGGRGSRKRGLSLEAADPFAEPWHVWIFSDRKKEKKVDSYNRYSSKVNYWRKALQWRENRKQQETEEKKCQGMNLKSNSRKRTLHRWAGKRKEKEAKTFFLIRLFFDWEGDIFSLWLSEKTRLKLRMGT